MQANELVREEETEREKRNKERGEEKKGWGEEEREKLTFIQTDRL